MLCMAEDEPKKSPFDVRKLPLQTFLPSVEDYHNLHTELNFTVLVARVLGTHLVSFKPFSDLIPQHIEHKYSAEMAKKSEIVSLSHFLYITSMHLSNTFL